MYGLYGFLLKQRALERIAHVWWNGLFWYRNALVHPHFNYTDVGQP